MFLRFVISRDICRLRLLRFLRFLKPLKLIILTLLMLLMFLRFLKLLRFLRKILIRSLMQHHHQPKNPSVTAVFVIGAIVCGHATPDVLILEMRGIVAIHAKLNTNRRMSL
jgi:hypothetical protein